MSIEIDKAEYKKFVIEIKEKIYQSQLQAMKAVNTELLALYTNIGKSIIEKQNLYGWGKSIVENLSKDLQKEFPGVNGFSTRNLWRMRGFYLEYKDNTKLPPLVAEIGWSHNLVIIEKCKDLLEREFYIKMTKKYGWTKNVLIHQIEGGAYEQFISNQTNFDKTLPQQYRHQAKLAVKDSYIFDFMELADKHQEKELEASLIKNVRSFLQEMGGDFAFMGNQYKLKLGNKSYFIDLLLYHRKLKCLVAIELKVTEFIPEYAGKMQFYLSILDDKVRLEDENPSIGIIICKSKDRTEVEYALKRTSSPVGVADYSLSKKLPTELKGLLPTAKEIEESLSNMIND